MTSIIRRSLAPLMFVALSAPPPQGIARVAWLQGCWEMRTSSRVVEEHWTPSRGHSMLGVGRTVRSDTLVEYEFVLLHEQGGVLAYEAHPSGQEGATFTSITVTDSSVVFESTAHDVPQRVGNRRASGDALVAWIEGTSKGTTRRIEFPYARVRCDGR